MYRVIVNGYCVDNNRSSGNTRKARKVFGETLKVPNEYSADTAECVLGFAYSRGIECEMRCSLIVCTWKSYFEN